MLTIEYICVIITLNNGIINLFNSEVRIFTFCLQIRHYFLTEIYGGYYEPFF